MRTIRRLGILKPHLQLIGGRWHANWLRHVAVSYIPYHAWLECREMRQNEIFVTQARWMQ